MKRILIKWTYLLALIAFAVWMFDVFFGANIYLRAEGLVLGQPAVIAAEYNVTVRDVLVKEGERVIEGQTVVHISSHQIAEARARLSSEAAARAARLADLDIRREVVNATIGPAENREAVALEGKNGLNESYQKGLLPALTRTTAAEQAYQGQKDAEALRAEKRALTDQIKMLTVATEQADLSPRLIRPGKAACAHDGYREYSTGQSWRGRARRRCAVGVGRRSPVRRCLGSGRAMVQPEGGPKCIDRCRRRRDRWNDCKDRYGGVGVAARISKGVYPDRTSAIGLD